MSSTPFQGVVTPEAVVLDFESAGVGSRSAAAAIDLIIRSVVLTLISIASAILSGVTSDFPTWFFITLFTLVTFFITAGYSIAFETLLHGRTPGKAALGLRVITTEGSPIRFRHAAIRGFLGLLEIAGTFGVVAAVTIFASKRNQRLGDLVAGTIVLRERRAEHQPVATHFQPPPGTEDYAFTLDASRLSTDEYLTLRSFLTRATQLAPAARQGLAEQLGRQFARRMATEPPHWMPAEVFLICVASAYQRRFAGSEPTNYAAQ